MPFLRPYASEDFESPKREEDAIKICLDPKSAHIRTGSTGGVEDFSPHACLAVSQKSVLRLQRR
jgi:hypothetical protein